MSEKTKLPKVWTDCPNVESYDHFIVRCPACMTAHRLDKKLFLSGTGIPPEGLVDTGLRRGYLSKARARLASLIAAGLTIIVIFTVLPPSGSYIQGAVYIVGIPALAVLTFIFRTLLSTQMRVWRYSCANCGQELFFVSNGKTAAYGAFQAKTPNVAAASPTDVRTEAQVVQNTRDSLVAGLMHKDAKVRKQAAAALFKIGDRPAIEAIWDRAQTDKSVNGYATGEFVNRVKGIRTTRAFFRGLRSGDKNIRDLAFTFYFNQHDAQALENLRRALESQKSGRKD
jgi:hypothetical protein